MFVLLQLNESTGSRYHTGTIKISNQTTKTPSEEKAGMAEEPSIYPYQYPSNSLKWLSEPFVLSAERPR
jgi:hypothetical protein